MRYDCNPYPGVDPNPCTCVLMLASSTVFDCTAPPSHARVSPHPTRHCTHHRNDVLLHELILAVGYFCVLNPHNQVLLTAGRSPTLVQLLCTLPFEYFSNPRYVSWYVYHVLHMYVHSYNTVQYVQYVCMYIHTYVCLCVCMYICMCDLLAVTYFTSQPHTHTYMPHTHH